MEEIGKQFGDEVAVHITDATDEERAAIDRQLMGEIQGDNKAPGNATNEIPSSNSSQYIATKQ